MRGRQRASRVLIVGSNPDIRHLIALQIKKTYGIASEEIAVHTEAITIVESRAVEVVIYSGSAWEHGVELYAVLLNYQGEACQFVMFMSDPSMLPPEFRGYFKVVAKPDFKKLLQTIDWERATRS